MDHLWTPWRYAYVTGADDRGRGGVAKKLEAWPGDLGCVFCNLVASVDYAIANGMSVDEAEGAAGLSSRHTLALINRGDATCADIERLQDHIVAAVDAKFGLTLEREPVLLG